MRRWLLSTALVGACAGGNSLETTGAFTTLAPTGDGDTSSGEDTDDTSSPDSTGGIEGSTSGPSDSSGGGPSGSSSSGIGEDSSSSGVELPPQPETSWWSHCTSTSECTDDLVCMLNGAGDDGVCTSLCTPAGDATSCGASPGVSAAPSCLNVDTNSICALDCSDGKDCPAGMLCLSDVDDDGPIEICL
ncbi:MAG: hypothetical protein ACE37F_05830 [Nannocystaceae bacterium]|nr:hypothetical protein [bacterium]